MKLKLTILGLLALSSLTYFVAKNRVICPKSDEFALCKELAKEAQLALGIPQERHAEVVKMQSNDPMYTYPAYCSNENDKIYVNTEMLSQIPYGGKRCIFCHESVHIKYNDAKSTPKVENRADTEGFYATGCSQCTHEMAYGRSLQNEDELIKDGYLTSKEINKISADLKKQHKLCQYHKDNKLTYA
ncbi:hypothetical protein M1446_02885 [Candidatus Dependentiae bacterium]|nr:hypothetical protein [Candidatus Dependentiae bacterium]